MLMGVCNPMLCPFRVLQAAKANRNKSKAAGPPSTAADPSGTVGGTVKINRKRKAKGANPLSMMKKKKGKPGQGGID